MKIRLLLIMLVGLMISTATAAAQNRGLVKATYDSNYGKMTLSINLETRQVMGFYAGDGKVLGTMDGNNRITGAWVHNKQQGLFELDLTDDYKSFTGKFGSGNTLTGGVWRGKSLSVDLVTGDENPESIERKGVYQAEYNTDYGLMKLMINFDKNEITGTYGVGGNITGKLNSSNRLVGFWGRLDKGRMEFDFTADFKKFTGKWGEKDNTLTDGVWMGECISINKID